MIRYTSGAVIGAVAALMAGNASAAIIANYDFNTFGDLVSNPSVPSSTVDPLATATNLDRDAGGTGNADGLGTLSATQTRDNTPDVFSSTALLIGAGTTARNPFAATPTDILASQDYVYFSLTSTPGAGNALDLSSLSFDYGVSVATTDTTGFQGAAQLFYQVNGGGFSPVGSRHDRTVPAGAAGFFTGFTNNSVSLAGLPELLPGDVIDFRLSFGDNSGAASTQKGHYIDNVIVEGVSVVVPEPTTLAMLALGGFAFGRRRA